MGKIIKNPDGSTTRISSSGRKFTYKSGGKFQQGGETESQKQKRLYEEMQKFPEPKISDDTHYDETRKEWVPSAKFKSDTLFVSNPNDPRLKTYEDSLYNYNIGQRLKGVMEPLASKEGMFGDNYTKVRKGSPYNLALLEALKKHKTLLDNSNTSINKDYPEGQKIGEIMDEYQKKGNKAILPENFNSYFPNPHKGVLDLATGRGALEMLGIVKHRTPGAVNLPEWKKPTQPVAYKEGLDLFKTTGRIREGYKEFAYRDTNGNYNTHYIPIEKVINFNKQEPTQIPQSTHNFAPKGKTEVPYYKQPKPDIKRKYYQEGNKYYMDFPDSKSKSQTIKRPISKETYRLGMQEQDEDLGIRVRYKNAGRIKRSC